MCPLLLQVVIRTQAALVQVMVPLSKKSFAQHAQYTSTACPSAIPCSIDDLVNSYNMINIPAKMLRRLWMHNGIISTCLRGDPSLKLGLDTDPPDACPSEYLLLASKSGTGPAMAAKITRRVVDKRGE